MRVHISDMGGGTLVIITHDRMLLDHLVDQLLIFDGLGNVRHFYGTYSEFLQAERASPSIDAVNNPPAATGVVASPKRKTNKDRPNAETAQQHPFSHLATANIETRIIDLEQQLADIDRQLALSDVYRYAPRVRQLVSNRDELARTLKPLEHEWLRRTEQAK